MLKDFKVAFVHLQKELMIKTVFWFRRDLRLYDNCALYHALQNGDVLPVFIFDTSILSQLEKDDARVSFIYKALQQIQTQLQQLGKSLAVFHGNPITIFEQLVQDHPITQVYANHDYEPKARKRDLEINNLLKKHRIAFKTCKDQVIFEKDEVVKKDGTPYVVFTPYANKWKEKLAVTSLGYYNSENLLEAIVLHPYPFPDLETIGFTPSVIKVPLYDITKPLLSHYTARRDYPAIQGTSQLSTHLRFGTISIRNIVKQALDHNAGVFLNELIWREFFMQILWHFPYTVHKSFKAKYDHIQWMNNEIQFEKWCNGTTGYPIVDAGMRELNATGLMHNRVRMITASFLCKHLLIDWRWGETYFASKLLDYEQASNVGNWQWAAGSGVDAAPYFRIFNPEEQMKKFDKSQVYIRQWVPEIGTQNYPEPVINHKEARERCLKIYKAAVG